MKNFILKHKFAFVCIVLMLIIALNLIIMNEKKTSSNQLQLAAYYDGKIIANPVEVSSSTDAELEISFTYMGERNKQFDLTLYWDYEQVQFEIDNKKYTTYSFFEENSSYTKNIKVKLDKKFDKSIQKITAVIDDKNFKELKRMRLRTQAIYTFLNSKAIDVKLDFDISEPYKVYTDYISSPLIINNDFDTNIKKYSEGRLSHSAGVLKAKPNSKINLALRFNNVVGIGKQLVVLELNNQQTKINTLPYLVYNLTSNDKAIFDNISIISPSSPGFYSVTAFIVPNFWGTNSRLYYHNTITFGLMVK